MSFQYLAADISLPGSTEHLRIAYLHSLPGEDQVLKGTIILLHGFPQISYQYRHVLPSLSAQGYRCVAPDYRGAGKSSQPQQEDFRKTTMASDIIALLDHLNITEPVHLIGHDIGGKIAFALASRYPERLRSLIWGENVLPGTTAYEKARSVPEQTVQFFHFIFHQVSPLAEQLVEGKEKLYVKHFLDKIAYNRTAFPDEVVGVYAKAYAQPGAMRAAMGVYRAFDSDDKETKEWIKIKGKCDVPTLILNGEMSKIEGVEGMAREVHQEDKMEVGTVERSGHYIAEENPEGFLDAVLKFLRKH